MQAKFTGLRPQQKEVLDAGINTFARVIQDEVAQVAGGVQDGVRNVAAGLYELGSAAATVASDGALFPMRVGEFAGNLIVNPKQAVADAAHAGAQVGKAIERTNEMAHRIGALSSAGAEYARDAVTGKVQPLSDFIGAARGMAARWDSLGTREKAAAGTEALCAVAPIEGVGWLGAMSVRGRGTAAGLENMRALCSDIDKDLAVKDAAYLKCERLAGAGGDWAVINERYSADVVKQCHPQACVAACGEMFEQRSNRSAHVDRGIRPVLAGRAAQERCDGGPELASQ
jgi:hypothetical protein